MSQENFSQTQQEVPTKTQTMDDIVKEIQSATGIISKLNNDPSVPFALKNKIIQDNERIIAELQSKKMDMFNAENKRKDEVAGFGERFDLPLEDNYGAIRETRENLTDFKKQANGPKTMGDPNKPYVG